MDRFDGPLDAKVEFSGQKLGRCPSLVVDKLNHASDKNKNSSEGQNKLFLAALNLRPGSDDEVLQGLKALDSKSDMFDTRKRTWTRR